ncbi:MAG: SMEK domain-containing protein [Brochothrix thermosphacta]|uniref:SMEK domain-containing protein n=1 Tax=Brochothrix thermosphacta TaxID=2756 RepID=UPI003F9399A1
MKKLELINRITGHFAMISSKIELQSTQNLHDINIFSEFFIRDLLNIVYGTSLENLNSTEQNSTAIDLVDYELKQALQITSTKTFTKIKHTVNGFVESKRNLTFEELFIFILTTKTPKFSHKTYSKDDFVFNVADNVKSFETLLSELMDKEIDILQKVISYLDKELLSETEDDITENEMATIVSLISYLSKNRKNSRLDTNDKKTIVDPNNKINSRFKKYAETLKNSYMELLSVYGGNLIGTAENHLGIDDVEGILLKEYLKDLSEEVLETNNGNPNKSLESLTISFQAALKKAGKRHDKMAIKFYLLDQTIKCNVFPIHDE